MFSQRYCQFMVEFLFLASALDAVSLIAFKIIEMALERKHTFMDDV